jgi:hypothetical protein
MQCLLYSLMSIRYARSMAFVRMARKCKAGSQLLSQSCRKCQGSTLLAGRGGKLARLRENREHRSAFPSRRCYPFRIPPDIAECDQKHRHHVDGEKQFFQSVICWAIGTPVKRSKQVHKGSFLPMRRYLQRELLRLNAKSSRICIVLPRPPTRPWSSTD